MTDILHAGDHRRNTCAGIGDLGGREEGVHHVLVFRSLDQIENIEELIGRIVEIVDNIRKVPEYAEVGRGGTHGGNSSDRRVAVGLARGVGVFRNTPDTLDGGILDFFLHLVHIGAFTRQRDGNEVDTASLANGEMAVVAGNGAKEFDLALILPGQAVTVGAEQDRAAHGIVHHIQAGVTAENDIFGRDTKKLGKQCGKLGNTVRQTVVTNIKAGSRQTVFLAFQRKEQLVGQTKLFRAGLAARHIQRKLLLANVPITFTQGCELCSECFFGHSGIRHRGLPPFAIRYPRYPSFWGMLPRRGYWKRP